MRPKAKEDIITFLKHNHAEILKFGVKKIGLFGSYVRKEQTDESDIDILVEFENDQINYNNYIELAFYLEDSFNTKIDLITIDSLSPYIGPNILKEVEYVSFR